MHEHADNEWQTQEAKAKFSALLRAAQDAPQWITHHGERAGVLLSEGEYLKLRGHKKQKPLTLGAFLRHSPLYQIGDMLDISRPDIQNPGRDLDFNDESYV